MKEEKEAVKKIQVFWILLTSLLTLEFRRLKGEIDTYGIGSKKVIQCLRKFGITPTKPKTASNADGAGEELGVQ
jgi:hypothetical protein